MSLDLSNGSQHSTHSGTGVNRTLKLVATGRRREAAEPEVQPIFSRIARDERSVGFLAVATIAERLSRLAGTTQIPFDNYLQDLVSDLHFTLDQSGRGNLTCTAARVSLPVGPAISLGLIAEQLVGHAVTHDYPAGQEKRIAISFGVRGSSVWLSVEDNGRIDHAKRVRRDDNLLIARLLILQLDGTLEVIEGRGGVTQTVVTVPCIGGGS